MNKLLLVVFSLIVLQGSLYSQLLWQDPLDNPSTFSQWAQQTQEVQSQWMQGSAQALSSAYWKIPHRVGVAATNDDACNCNKSKDVLFSPWISLNQEDSLILSVDLFFNQGFYNNNQEQAYVFYQTDAQKIYIDTLAGAIDWQTHLYAILLNNPTDSLRIGFEYSDQGGWLFGLAIDQVSLWKGSLIDLHLKKITTAQILTQGDSLPIRIQVSNIGLDTSSASILTVIYGAQTYSQKIGSIKPLQTLDLLLTDTFVVDTLQGNSLQVIVQDSLGQDVNMSNQNLSNQWILLDHANYQNVLIESFVSAACTPCITQVQPFYQALESEWINDEFSFYHIQYHHQDAAEILGNAIRKQEYDSLSDPYVMIQGQQAPLSTELFTSGYLYPISNQYSAFDLSHSFYTQADSIHIQAQMIPQAHFFQDSLYLMISVVERNMTLDSNTWKNVARLHLTGDLGLALDSVWIKDSIYTFEAHGKMVQSSSITPFSGYFSSTPDNIAVILWVQNRLTKEILQVDGSRWATSIAETKTQHVLPAYVYPNPSNKSEAYVGGDFKMLKNAQWSLYNLQGVCVWTTSSLDIHPGTNVPYVPSVPGYYVWQIKQNEQTIQMPWIIQ